MRSRSQGQRRAVIMAGGQGKRLRPFTDVLPKPLTPINGRPILEILLLQLKHHGFSRITICLGYLAELIANFFDDGSRWGLEIDYVVDTEEMGPVGPLSRLHLDEPFLTLNGDILTDLNFSELFERHAQYETALTLACSRQTIDLAFGLMKFDATHTLTQFREKPQLEYWGCMGISAMSPEVLEYVPHDRPSGLDELANTLQRAQNPPSVFPYEGLWFDLATPDDVNQASRHLESHRHLLLPSP